MIVVGTDFSADSLRALNIAQRVAKTLSTSVTLVHVKPHIDSTLPATAQDWLKHAGVDRDELVIKAGTAWLELLRYAEETDAEFICIAAHGTSGYQALTAGSNARRLVLRSSMPVIMAPTVNAPIKIAHEAHQ
jgi:nucleotide-binding universal stress UspA family protein